MRLTFRCNNASCRLPVWQIIASKWRFNICWYFLKGRNPLWFPITRGSQDLCISKNSSQYHTKVMFLHHKAGLPSLHEVILSEDAGPGARPWPPHGEHGGHPGVPGLEALFGLHHPLVPTGLGVWSRESCIMDIFLLATEVALQSFDGLCNE